MIKKISDIIDRVVTTISCLLLIGTIVCVFLAVADRYVFKVSMFWTEEAARFFFTWMAMVAPAIMVLRRGHYDMTYFVDKLLGERAKKILSLVIRVVCLTATCASAVYGWQLMIKLQRQRMPTLPFSIKYWYLCIPVGMGIMAIAFILTIIEDINSLKTLKTIKE